MRPRFARLASTHLFPGLYADSHVLMKEASAQDDSIREGYEIVELPSAPFPTGYFSHILFTGIMSVGFGFDRKGDEYDVDFECVIPFNLAPDLLDNTRLRRVTAST